MHSVNADAPAGKLINTTLALDPDIFNSMTSGFELKSISIIFCCEINVIQISIGEPT